MTDPSFVLDLRSLVEQEIVREGAWVPDGRILFKDPASRVVHGAVAFTLDTRQPDDPKLTLRYDVVRTGEAVRLDVPLRFAAGRARGFRQRFVCPLGCRRTAVRLHLPGGATRFGCRSCQRTLLRLSEGPPALRPTVRLGR